MVEVCESRLLLSAAATPWLNPEHLTLSFAPDGTSIAGHESSAFTTFGSGADAAIWQRAILQAFQTWANYADINIGVVSDGGQAFGIGGLTQGDSRFGDIRIGAVPMSPDVLSISIPQDRALAGTWGGDILFNSNADFSNPEDLFAVALHEAGHVLGLEHSSDPDSPMFAHNTPGIAKLPTAADIAGLQAMYGLRSDLHEDNDSLENATRIRYSQNSDGYNGETPLVHYGDISDLEDIDYFFLPALDGYTGPVTFRLQTSELSLLAVHMKVLDAQGEKLEEAELADSDGGILLITIDETDPGAKYFVEIEASNLAENAVGRFALIATFDERNVIDDATLDAVVTEGFDTLEPADFSAWFTSGQTPNFNDDLHTDDTLLTATSLKTSEAFEEFSHYEVVASISDSTDVDYYSFKSTDAFNDSGSTVMTVTVQSLEQGRLIPKITVLDRNDNVLPHDILVNGNGTLTVQVVGVDAKKTYHVRVEAADASGPFATGNYRMTVDFSSEAVQREEFAAGVLTGTDSDQSFRLDVNQTQLFQFSLQSSPASGSVPVALDLRIFDSNGQEVYRLVEFAGEARSANSILMTAGTYVVRVTAFRADGQPLAGPITFSLLGSALSDPIGPILADPTSTTPTDPVLDPYLWTNVIVEPYTLIVDPMTIDPWWYLPPTQTIVTEPTPIISPIDISMWYWFEGLT